MNDSADDNQISSNASPSRGDAVRDIALMGFPIVLCGAVGYAIGIETISGGLLVNLGYVLSIILGGRLLKQRGTNWSDVGLAKPERIGMTLLAGLGAWAGALFLFVIAQVLAVTIISIFGMEPPALDQSRFNPVEGNLWLWLLMLLLAWTTIAFGEELFYRAFLISRLIDVGGVGRWPVILISAAVFAVIHFAEGPIGILSNGAFGILFAWIYLKSGRNLWITLLAHGLLNSLRFTLLYAGAA